MQIKELEDHGLRDPARHRGLPVDHRRAYIGIKEALESETGILAGG